MHEENNNISIDHLNFLLFLPSRLSFLLLLYNICTKTHSRINYDRARARANQQDIVDRTTLPILIIRVLCYIAMGIRSTLGTRILPLSFSLINNYVRSIIIIL